MKLTIFLLTAACLHVTARGVSQNVSFSGENVALTTIFKAVKKQTGFVFVYTNITLQTAKPVTIDVSNVPLEQFLENVFKNQPLTFEISGKDIFISPKEKKEDEKRLPKPEAVLPPPPVKIRVIDEDGNALSGATVVNRNTKSSGQTSAEGALSLNVDAGDVLEISFVGYETQVVKITAKQINEATSAVGASSDRQPNKNIADILIVLKRGVTDLNEVVVNQGYYNRKQRFNTGNVVTITNEDIEKQPVSNPLQALSGRVPGLYVQEQSGIAGTGLKLSLRGRNSIFRATDDPLYIIDGVPFSSGTLDVASGVAGSFFSSYGMSPFNALNTADIETITVLKDADATAIYGSRGANGVILITTKKAKAGPVKVGLKAYTGRTTLSTTPDLLSTTDYLMMRREAYKNDGLTTIPEYAFDINGTWDTTRNTNWVKELFKPSVFSNAQLNISGGNSQTKFLLGAGYNYQGVNFPGDYGDKKISVYNNLSHSSVDQRFNLGFNIAYTNDNNNIPGAGIETAMFLPPDAPKLYDQYGNINWAPTTNYTSTWNNPLSYKFTTSSATVRTLIASLNLDYLVAKGLRVKANVGYNTVDMSQSNQVSGGFVPISSLSNTRRKNYLGSSRSVNWIAEPQLDYSKKIGAGDLHVLVGSTFQQTKRESYSWITSGFSSDELIANPQNASSKTLYAYRSTVYRYSSVYGQLNYNYKATYLINLTARRDGSSRFGPGRQFGDFGALGAGWIFSNLKPFVNNLHFLSFGKLRASYGLTGSDNVGDYQYLSTYSPVSGSQTYQGIVGLQPTGHTNPYYAWEENRQFEGGIDLGFLKDRIYLSASYYRKRSGNQLINWPLPYLTGFSSVVSNRPAIVDNYGWEFTFNTVNIHSRTFEWRTFGNLSIPKNKLVAFPRKDELGYKYLAIGESINSPYFYHSTGVDPQTGLYTFQQKDPAQLTVDDKIVLTNKPLTQLFHGGIGNEISYKQFKLEFFVQFVKQWGINMFYSNPTSPGNMSNQLSYVMNRWQKPGDIASVQKFSSEDIDVTYAFLNFLESDALISDASYARLKNVSLSYQFKKDWLTKAKISQASLFIQCQNLFTVTNYLGIDPEAQGTAVPPLRTVTAGFQLQF